MQTTQTNPTRQTGVGQHAVRRVAPFQMGHHNMIGAHVFSTGQALLTGGIAVSADDHRNRIISQMQTTDLCAGGDASVYGQIQITGREFALEVFARDRAAADTYIRRARLQMLHQHRQCGRFKCIAQRNPEFHVQRFRHKFIRRHGAKQAFQTGMDIADNMACALSRNHPVTLARKEWIVKHFTQTTQ